VQISNDLELPLSIHGLEIDLSKPQVMAILNLNKDSFYQPSHCSSLQSFKRAVQRYIAEGATILDLGAQSSRPGSAIVSVQEEQDRLLPALEWVLRECPLVVSVDTDKPEVMGEAIAMGCHIINDIRALTVDGAIEKLRNSQAAVCLMHMQGDPLTMQNNPGYQDVVQEVGDFLRERVAACIAAGISKRRIIVDPGFGFGKNLEHNLQLMRNIAAFKDLGAAVLLGISRKSMFAKALDLPIDKRLPPALALTAYAYLQGVRIFRSHDVAATVHALEMLRQTCEA
jgi:dihydropteroate synthase